MYDAALSDMVQHEEYLMQVATFFIRKTELNYDMDKMQFPLCDRIESLDDLMECELAYQFKKSQLLMTYLEVFEHVCDPLIQ